RHAGGAGPPPPTVFFVRAHHPPAATRSLPIRTEVIFTLPLSLAAHCQERPVASACLHRGMPQGSSHSTPAHAVFAEPDSRQSPLSFPPASPAHRPRRFPPALAALRSPCPLRAAAACPRLSPFRQPSPVPLATRLWRSHRC